MNVRSRFGPPNLSDFKGSGGSPLVIDRDTGICYILGAGDQILQIEITTKENISNKVVVLDSGSTNVQYPSAKVVYDELQLRELLSNKVTSISATSTDDEYPSALAVYGEVAAIDSRLDTAEGEIDSLQSGKEDISNKVTSLSGASTDVQYPSAKATWDNLQRRGDLTTNYTAWDSSGHQTMVGNARPWRDELTDALNIRSTGSGVSANNTESTVDFSATAQIANDYCYLNIQLNHDKDLSASIYPHIHFFQASNAVPNFLLQYRWQVNGGAKVTSWTNLKCNSLAFTYVSGTLSQIAYSSPITPPVGSTLSDIVQFRICRDTDNDSTLFTGADPYSGVVGFMAFDVHFMLNSLGSTDELSK